MEKEFTATCYIIHQEKFLLLFHKKHQKWLPPGGHLEENETPHECAKREVMEESGLEIVFIEDENLHVAYPHAVSIPRPYLILQETMPPYKETPAHQHIDFIYIAEPIGGELIDGRWFSAEEVEQLIAGEEVFQDTKDVILKLHTERVCV